MPQKNVFLWFNRKFYSKLRCKEFGNHARLLCLYNCVRERYNCGRQCSERCENLCWNGETDCISGWMFQIVCHECVPVSVSYMSFVCGRPWNCCSYRWPEHWKHFLCAPCRSACRSKFCNPCRYLLFTRWRIHRYLFPFLGLSCCFLLIRMNCSHATEHYFVLAEFIYSNNLFKLNSLGIHTSKTALYNNQ